MYYIGCATVAILFFLFMVKCIALVREFAIQKDNGGTASGIAVGLLTVLLIPIWMLGVFIRRFKNR